MQIIYEVICYEKFACGSVTGVVERNWNCVFREYLDNIVYLCNGATFCE